MIVFRVLHGPRQHEGQFGGYPVEFLLDLLSGGTTAEQILADYPALERDDLRAVFAYAAQLSRVQRIDPAVA